MLSCASTAGFWETIGQGNNVGLWRVFRSPAISVLPSQSVWCWYLSHRPQPGLVSPGGERRGKNYFQWTAQLRRWQQCYTEARRPRPMFRRNSPTPACSLAVKDDGMLILPSSSSAPHQPPVSNRTSMPTLLPCAVAPVCLKGELPQLSSA